ncbi:nucleotidyltransferase family protein [Undibacterium sp. TJN19]|uniref:nucleotidyltransferase family protein n=1 Tax=Undibacterium sp. TJN19 TaxID=3413055 RepID=UPI003BEF7BE5
MTSPLRWTGILLAAGRGRRFDASGANNKLLQPLTAGGSVAQQSAGNLLAVMPQVVAVLRPDTHALTEQLLALGVHCEICANADAGMAHSLQQGLRYSADSAGWLIALADMPFVKPSTILDLLQALQNGAGIVVPVYQGQRGNPVGFAQRYLPQLLTLQGDTGARGLLQSAETVLVEVDDAGIHRDVDVPEDLN